MSRKISTKRRRQLIGDIISAKHDLISLSDQYNLEPDDLAAWIADPNNHRTLSGLCVLADLQTQVLLSRYRLLAAGRLIKLATEEGPENSGDVARRACVDLLKLDLKRADVDDVGLRSTKSFGHDPGDDDCDMGTLRKMLYGNEDVVAPRDTHTDKRKQGRPDKGTASQSRQT